VTALPGLASIWDGVVGQPAAVEHLRRAAAAPVHAYLLVGPSGSTKHEAARAFAAALLAGDDDPGGRDARLALAGEHPDVHEVERIGAAISKDQAVEIVHLTSLAPVEGSRKVLILHDFHLLTGEAAARLLKSIEEPPPSTIFVVLADFVPLDLITISSRCVRIDFRSIPDDVLAARLRADGVDVETTAVVVAAAGGDLTRARLLAHDPALVERRRAFADLPRRLDGTGSTVMAAVDDVLAQIDAAAGPLTERQAAEVAEVDARREQFGERGSGRKALEERHKRELRRHRVDELRSGLAVLAGAYRDRLVAGGNQRPEALIDAVARIHDTIEALERNPNEPLLLQSLLWSLPADAGR
jgi:DNA polymerase-3 subunit delta'